MPGLQVFLLDDNLDMQSTVREIVGRLNGVLHTARSLTEAVVWLNNNSMIQIDVAMFDLMIPIEESTLPAIDELLEKRGEKCRIVTRRARTDEEKRRQADAMLQLDAIDKRLGELIPVDGGIQFLRTDAAKKLTEVSAHKIAVFSARRPDHQESGVPRTLSEDVEEALGRRFDEWFEKPVQIADFEDWLKKIETGRVAGTTSKEPRQ